MEADPDHDSVVPGGTVGNIIVELHEQYRDCDEGAIADYIPELTRADPGWFGISVFTVD